MSKKCLIFLICVFMFSIFLMSDLAYSYPNNPLGTTQARDYNGIIKILRNREKSLSSRKTNILESKGVIASLDASWKSNEDAIKAGNVATLNASLNTFIGTMAAISTSGMSAVATYGSTFLSAYKTFSSSTKTGQKTRNRESFSKGFDNALGGFDAAVAWQKQEHDAYTRIYVNDYLRMEADHSGGLYTYVGSQQYGPHTKLDLYSLIHGTSITENGSQLVIGAYVDDPSRKKETGYYHGSPTGPDHVMETHLHWDQVDIIPLKSETECEGTNCSVTYRTHYEAWKDHFRKCGTAKGLSQLIRESLNTGFQYTAGSFIIELRMRSVAQGCGYEWYSCDSDHTTRRNRHKVRKCTISIPLSGGGTRTCNDSFRTCMEHKKDHDESTRWNLKTLHSHTSSSTPPSATPPPSTPPPSTPTTPTYHACGTHETTVSGNHESAGCGTTGHYLCDGSSHGAAACSISGHYQCDNREHVLLTCPTDPNNQNCEYSSYYSCSPHEHAYPPVDNTPNCSNCTDGCSSCQATCVNGHTYDPRVAVQVNRHRTRTCRFSNCGQTWQGCGSGAPICNKPYRKKNGMSCQAND